VFAGQSNMEGQAEVNTINTTDPLHRPLNGTLRHQVTDLRTAQLFSQTWNKTSNHWAILNNVKIWFNEAGTTQGINGSVIPGKNNVDASFGSLTVGYGVNGPLVNQGNNIGPEYGFGFGMNARLKNEERILIIKTAWGGKTLAGDFRPPSSTTTIDPFCNLDVDSACGTVGHFYNVMVEDVKKIMKPGVIGQMFPDLVGMPAELSGFGWFQGWNDGCDLNQTAAYEQNMIHLIQDLRKEWKNPTLPVVIAASGFDGFNRQEATRSPVQGYWPDFNSKDKIATSCKHDHGCRRLDVVLSQFAAANATRHPEFLNNVMTMETRNFWREAQYSPNKAQGYHFWHNAETYFLVGQAMAKGMARMSSVSLPPLAASLPLPTPPQVWYQQGEIHALIHFNMATFAKDGDPGCSAENWNQKASYAAGLTSNPATFAPSQLNTSQWSDIMLALGAKGAILTAKHGCGHLLWPTKTKLPNGSTYPYAVGTSKSFIKGDVLAMFQASMSSAGIKHGFYYSLTNNFFLNVGDHKAHASPTPLPGQQNVTQTEFETIALGQVKELWTNYGELGEIWFDGGYTSDMKSSLATVLANQKNAIGFGGYGISPNPSTWDGTESGKPDCPQGIWSLGGSFCGDPNSTDFIPKTCDTTLQTFDHWFWQPPSTSIRNLSQLIQIYHDTVGNNGVLELDFAIDRDGLVAPEHEIMYRALGSWIKECYGTPSKLTTTTSKQIDAETWEYTLAPVITPTLIDRIILREDIAFGQRVRSWSIVQTKGAAGEVTNVTRLSEGTSIGNRRVVLLSNVTSVVELTLTVVAVAEPKWMQIAMAKCNKIKVS